MPQKKTQESRFGDWPVRLGMHMICRALFPSLLSFITVNGIMITRCACGKCESMPTARESVCCQEIPEVEE